MRLYLTIKRTFDFVLSLFAIFLLSPFLLVFTLLIKLSSRGPVLFKQVRIGKNKVHFESRWWRENGKDVLDDNKRISLTASWDKLYIKNKRWREAYEPIKKWEEQNNPCINCTIKKYYPDSPMVKEYNKLLGS